MAVSTIDASSVVIDLDDPPTGHRLAELVQLLSGCTAERAELAVSDPTPSGPASTPWPRRSCACGRRNPRSAEARGPSGPRSSDQAQERAGASAPSSSSTS